MKKILIIIPAYNEQASIKKVYQDIQKYNQENNTQYDVIVVNDGSTDNTLNICVENSIPVVSLINNLGIGGAVQTGYKYARDNNYDVAIQYDGDGQHDVNYVKDIINPVLNGDADLVIGSRFIKKGASDFQSSSARRLGIKIISIAIKVVTGKKIYDVTSGFRASGKEVIKEFANTYPIDYPEPITNTELLKRGFKVTEIPVAMKERSGGVSSIRSWKSAYFMMNVVLSVLLVGIRRYKNVK